MEFEPIRVACDYVRLFTDPEFLLTQYSSEQLEQGFWAMPSCNIECSVAEIIWHKQVPFVVREKFPTKQLASSLVHTAL